MAMELYGWRATLTELHNGTKGYKIYTLRNDATREIRAVYNWGKRTAVNGQWKVDVGSDGGNKMWQKRDEGYSVAKADVPIPVTQTLLTRAGIDWAVAMRLSQPPQVEVSEVSALKGFTESLGQVTKTFATSGVTAEVLVQFTKLQVQMNQIKRELEQAESQMEMLTAMIEGADAEAWA